MVDSEQILRKLLNEIAVEQGLTKYDVEIQPISSGGANYTTKLYLVTIKGEEDLELFAKVATIGEKMRKSALIYAFETERFFYTKLSKVYRDIEDKFNVPQEHRLSIPKFYGCNPNYLEEIIVLENLVHQGFGDYNRFVSVDWPYASKAVEQLAIFHALSHAYKRYNPEEFNKMEQLKFEWDIPEDQALVIWQSGAKAASDVTAEENKSRVEDALKNANINECTRFFFTPVDTCLIIHSDFRVSNLLHKYNDDGSVTIKIVDLQTIRGGCSASDLIYFLVTSTDEEFRREHYQRLMDHYYEQLCAALRRLDINPDDVYPRKVFDYELKEKLKFALILAVFILPLMTVESENAPQMDMDSDFTSFGNIKISDVFGPRINGIINDCIRWGII